MRKIVYLAFCVMALMACQSRTNDTTVQHVVLWPDGVPSDNGLSGQEIDLGWGYQLVTDPELTIFPAEHPNGQAVLMCPGGGYYNVCYRHEGYDWADWLNEQGITLAVLKYRIPNQHHAIPLEDGQKAMTMLREMGKQLGFSQIGVMGFSAGGHLASTIATHFTTEMDRPDFQILVYPVISMDTAITHMGSREGLIGYAPDDELVRLYSNEQQVTMQTPPALLVLSGNDDLVPIANSLRYYQAMQEAHVPVELMMYPTNGHGWGFNDTPFHAIMLEQMAAWLKQQAH